MRRSPAHTPGSDFKAKVPIPEACSDPCPHCCGQIVCSRLLVLLRHGSPWAPDAFLSGILKRNTAEIYSCITQLQQAEPQHAVLATHWWQLCVVETSITFSLRLTRWTWNVPALCAVRSAWLPIAENSLRIAITSYSPEDNTCWFLVELRKCDMRLGQWVTANEWPPCSPRLLVGMSSIWFRASHRSSTWRQFSWRSAPFWPTVTSPLRLDSADACTSIDCRHGFVCFEHGKMQLMFDAQFISCSVTVQRGRREHFPIQHVLHVKCLRRSHHTRSQCPQRVRKCIFYQFSVKLAFLSRSWRVSELGIQSLKLQCLVLKPSIWRRSPHRRCAKLTERLRTNVLSGRDGSHFEIVKGLGSPSMGIGSQLAKRVRPSLNFTSLIAHVATTTLSTHPRCTCQCFVVRGQIWEKVLAYELIVSTAFLSPSAEAMVNSSVSAPANVLVV